MIDKLLNENLSLSILIIVVKAMAKECTNLPLQEHQLQRLHG